MPVMTSRFPAGSDANRNDYVADRRLYLNDAGQVVEADDPARRVLLVAAGGSVPQARARELGLYDRAAPPPASGGDTAEMQARAMPADADADAEAGAAMKAVEGPAADKAVRAPRATKGR